MKITSSSIGTLQQPQAAKHLYNYQWSHNAVGDTIGGTAEGETLSIRRTHNIDASAHPKGILIDATARGSFWDVYEANSLKTSGPLNLVDTVRGRYLHLVFDFDGTGTTASGGTISNSLYWYADDDDDDYAPNDDGVSPTKTIKIGTKTILVYDMNGTSIGGSGTTTWEVNADPLRIQYFHATGSGSQNAVYIYHGMVLSDRILADIPLPVATHVG